ncbi:MAG: hypothetical protein ACPGXK_04655 [Phycisphaerae bacterium]
MTDRNRLFGATASIFSLGLLISLMSSSQVVGAEPTNGYQSTSPYSLSLSTASLIEEEEEAMEEEVMSEEVTEETTVTYTGNYLGINDFFNVREANSDVAQGQWEYEVETGWATGGGGDDDYYIATSLKYGITDMMFVELRVLPMNLGDGGGQGVGELEFILFNQFLEETDTLPAFAFWSNMRIPTGEGSEGVDARFNFNFTKTLVENLRGHLFGYAETANGSWGDEDRRGRNTGRYSNDWGRSGWGGGWGRGLWDGHNEYDRRHFQWGLGAGVDYQIDDQTVAAMNYLHRSNDSYGVANDHILQLGLNHQLSDDQSLKFAVDIGLDGRDEKENFGMKLMWAIRF